MLFLRLELDGNSTNLHAVERERSSHSPRTKHGHSLGRTKSNEGSTDRLALGQLEKRAFHELNEPRKGSR